MLKKNLPNTPSLLKSIGPGFILLGLAFGSGELILWPYLTANYGLGIIWGALLGITLQYFLNTEIMRYSLYTGESIFIGFKKLNKILPIWFLIATFVPFGLPGFSSASSYLLSEILGIQNHKSLIAVFFLFFCGVLLSSGKYLYKTIETIQKSVTFIALPFIIIVSIAVLKTVDIQEYFQGLVGIGNGYYFLPKEIDIAIFLGALAYSGAGGLLNMAQSNYIKEKGLGMGAYMPKISSLFSKNLKKIEVEGIEFEDNKTNRKEWKKLFRVVTLEHFLIFWVLGFLTISILAVNAKALLFGRGDLTSGISFLIVQGSELDKVFPFFGLFFLLVAVLMLLGTQVGVLEATSRIISENIMVIFKKPGQGVNLSLYFYVSLWAQIAFGIILLLLGFNEPKLLLTLGAVLNAIAMFSAFPLVYILNKKYLKNFYHPSIFRRFFMILGIITFASLLFFVIEKNILR